MAKTTKDPRVVALAQQLGTVLGRAQAKADKLLKQVKAKAKPKAKTAPAKKVAPPKVKARSGGAVDAPGKKHRKPPPQEKFSRGMTEPKVQQMGQKGIKGRMQRGGSNR